MQAPNSLGESLSQFGVRVVQEAMAAALPFTWQRRAEALEAARPRPGEFHGKASAAELAARDARLAEEAASCRRHAEFLAAYPHDIAAAIAEEVGHLMGKEAAA